MNKRKILGGMLLVCLMLGMIPISSGVGKSDFLIKVPDELPNGATITDITGYKEIKDEIDDYYPHAIDGMAYDYSDNSVICILVFSSVTDTQKDFKHSFSTFSELEGGMQFEDFVVYHSEFKQLFDSSSTWIKKNAWIGEFDEVTFTLDNYVIFIDPLSIPEGIKIAEMVYSLNQEILTSTAQALKYAPTPQELPEVFYYTSIETGPPQILDVLQKECGMRPIYGEFVEGLSKTEEPADLGMCVVEFLNAEDAKEYYLCYSNKLSVDLYVTEIDAFGDESISGYGPVTDVSGHIVGISDDFVTVFRNDRFIASIMTNDMDELNNSKIVVTDILPKMIDEKLEQVKATILLENPRFESGELDPWYSTEYSDPYEKCERIFIGVDSEAHYEGLYGAYIDIQCSLDAWGRIIQEPIEITLGKSLAVEAKLMYKGDLNSGYAELWLVFLDADKKALDHVYKKYYESDFGAEDKWLSAVLPATTVPSNAKYVRVMVGLADVKSCRLNIDDVMLKSESATGNHPPTATKIEPTSDSITIEPGEPQEFKVKAEDVDEDVHNNLHMIQWFVDDIWVETDAADGTSAEVSFSYTFENAGTFYVKATAYDEQMEVDSMTWRVIVGEDEGLIEKEILDNKGNEVGLNVRIVSPTTLSLKESGYSELGWLDIKLKTQDFEDATFPDDYTNLISGYIMVASDEDMYVDLDGVEFEVAPVPQMLHPEAFGWKDYINFLEQEKNEWGWRTFALILSVIPGTSEVMTLQEAFGIVWKEIEYDIGGEPRDISFYDMNNFDIWEYPWTFELNSIAGAVREQRGNGVHLRIPFVYEKAGKHEIHISLFIDYNGRKGSGLLDSSPSYTIGKEYTCDINVG